MNLDLAISYETPAQIARAQMLAEQLQLPINNNATNRLVVGVDKLMLKIGSFLPLYPDFTIQTWQHRRDAGKQQGLFRAVKPYPGMKIIDATAGWGHDAAVLASFGAEVLLLERNPVLFVLLEDALLRQDARSKSVLKLSVLLVDSIDYLSELSASTAIPNTTSGDLFAGSSAGSNSELQGQAAERRLVETPEVIYLDPMHPLRQKEALVKGPLQALQQLIGPDQDIPHLLAVARQVASNKVVVKWPQKLPPILTPVRSIPGKTVRFDLFIKEELSDHYL